MEKNMFIVNIVIRKMKKKAIAKYNLLDLKNHIIDICLEIYSYQLL